MAFYYPEGSFGPICDVILPPSTTEYKRPGGIEPPEDPAIIVIGDPRDDPPEGPPTRQFFPGLPRFISQRCKVRPDGTFHDLSLIHI